MRRMQKRIFGFTIAIAFVFGFISTPFYAGLFADAQGTPSSTASSPLSQTPTVSLNDKEQRRSELEQQLADLERQINDN